MAAPRDRTEELMREYKVVDVRATGVMPTATRKGRITVKTDPLP